MMAYMLMTSLMGFIDSLMLSGSGENALAALGIGGSILLFLFSPTMAFIEISQIFAAKCIRKSATLQNTIFNSFLILSTIVSILIIISSYYLIPLLIPFFDQNDAVILKIHEYTSIRVYEILFAGIVFVSEGFWNGLNKPKYNLSAFALMQVINIGLNYALIYGHFGLPPLGISGAAYSSVIAVAFGAFVFLYIAYVQHFHGTKVKFKKDIFKAILAKLTPRMIGSLSIVMGYVLLYVVIGQLGTTATAVSNILIGFYIVFSTLIFAFGKTATTFVGQALGCKKENQATYWGWKTAMISFLFFLFIGALLFMFSNVIAKMLFTNSPHAQQLFSILFSLYAIIVPLESIGITLSQALMGFGRVTTVTIIFLLSEWLIALPGAWYIGVSQGYGLAGIWAVYIMKWLLESVIFFLLWKHVTKKASTS